MHIFFSKLYPPKNNPFETGCKQHNADSKRETPKKTTQHDQQQTPKGTKKQKNTTKQNKNTNKNKQQKKKTDNTGISQFADLIESSVRKAITLVYTFCVFQLQFCRCPLGSLQRAVLGYNKQSTNQIKYNNYNNYCFPIGVAS